jgi:two-component system, LuxR family, sensor kinase FixL
MRKRNTGYEELRSRLAEAETLLTALRAGEVDAVISGSSVLLLCVQEAEAALLEREARYQSLFEHSLDAILLNATDGRILMANPAACRLFGWTADELGHMREHALLDHSNPTALIEWAARVGTEHFQGELRYRRKDGSTFIGETSSATFGEQSGEKKTTVVIRDITERNRAEELLHNARAEITDVTRVKTIEETMTLIADEINQPLGAIVNNGNACLRLIAAGPEPRNEAREALSDIVNDAERASAIIRRIRALVQRSATERSWLQVGDVIAEALALAHRELVDNRITAGTEFSDDLPRIWGDRIQLEQVFLNLILNAVEAMIAVQDNRRVLIIRAQRDSLENKPAVLVSMEDRGDGFTPEDGERLFDAFFTTKQHGMGMGLRISRSIVEADGGRLWASCNEDHGATFRLIFPAED